ncbi:MAG TPA: YraN family protein, partial [Tepidiformaceae bacterium]|nr:YraN family protein [Tepidiformaceae bacterium]
MNERQNLGAFGERVAASHLEAAGLTIIGRNVRIARTEVDIVARDRNDTVFVEVRTRRGAPGLAAESIVPAKLQRIWAFALAYCEREALEPESIRLDVVVVELDAGGVARNVEHIRGV